MRNFVILLSALEIAARAVPAAGPTTFEDLAPGTALSFMVAAGAHGESLPYPGMIRCEIEIDSSTPPQAIIKLGQDAVASSERPETVWGHRVGVPVKRVLSPADRRYLDSYLARYLSRRPVTDLAVRNTYSAREFDWQRVAGFPATRRTFVYADTQLDAEFIHSFLGIPW